MFVIKRDGDIVPFDVARITNAIEKCFQQTNAQTDVQTIVADVSAVISSQQKINIEAIQDVVENVLMKHGLYSQAKSYILYRKQHEMNRKSYIEKINFDIPVPWGPIGYPTYKRTYARRLQNDPNKTEEFRDTILRVLDAANTQLHIGFTNAELVKAYRYMMNLKCSVAGRFLWQLGTETINKYGLMSLQNCAFVKIDEPIKPFLWIFDILMLGVGAGASVERKHVSKLPPVKPNKIEVTRKDTKDADFIVPDSREGWVSLLEKVLEAYFIKGTSFTYSTILIRSAGSVINGFGGIASGPDELCKGIANICKILNARLGEQLTSVDCLDIITIIAAIVVSGNVRRSAIIILGDYDDTEFLKAKRWDLGSIPIWRCNSNNSVVCSDVSKLPDLFWEGYIGNGEPYGLVNIDLMRKCGRLKDGDKYPDPDVEGVNPCGEQPLVNKQTCCLGEIILSNINSYEELEDILSIIYRFLKHSLMLPCHHKDTEEIVHKEMRMGIGITGYAQCTEEQKGWLSDAYEFLRRYDEEYSLSRGFNKSVKLTTVKPSGTLSLLPGVTPGCHPGIYRYFIRRIRFSSSNNLSNVFKQNGYDCEYQLNFDGSYDHSTIVVSFPCKYPEHTKLAKDMTAIDQLNTMKELQTNWSDNNVSITIYYKKEELPAIKRWLAENYTNKVKACSFLLHNEHGFKQAPYEEITEEQYTAMCKKVKPITNSNDIVTEDDYTLECAKGACPLK